MGVLNEKRCKTAIDFAKSSGTTAFNIVTHVSNRVKHKYK